MTDRGLPRYDLSREWFIAQQATVLVMTLTLEDDAARDGSLFWAAHFAGQADAAFAAAWAAVTGIRHV